MLLIYRIAINLIVFLSPIIILIRLFKKKEDPIRFKEKLCFFSKKKSKGNLIWFHGASVGEILSIIPLVEKLEKNRKINQILLTSNTLSSSKIISNLKLKKTIHQFFPIDSNYHTQKFLDYWKPSIVFFIDSEIWPNMLTNIKKRSISLVLLNARITKKSFKKWKIFISSAKNLFEKFDICFSSSLQSKKYLKHLGAKKIKYIGNLKFSQTEKKEDLLSKNLKKYFLSKKIWCAASTHDTEEKFCFIAHKKLKKKYKNLLTIIIPRHINRTENIIEEIQNLNLKVHVHDSNNKIDNNTDIYLVNAYGKTKSFYKVCKTVFLGGSLIKHGGQNPLEAAKYGCKILHGPNISNFQEIYSMLNKYGLSNKVVNSNQIINKVKKSFNNKNNTQNIKIKIKNLGDKILKLTLKEVSFLVEKNET
jgi:3-deoxy-D-manno-octulosonic-acid transferase|tara:strand:- start:4190 stop:5446 length:1257 start_codon:yes stop_codon:yes gene_type:complete